MKIVFLAPFGIRPKGTLIARMLPLAQELQLLGHEVVIIAPPYTNPEDSGRVEDVGGVKVSNIDLINAAAPVAAPVLAWRMFRALQGERPDLVHLFKPKGYGGLAALLLILLRRLGIRQPPLFVDCDDWEGRGGMNDLHPYRPMEKQLFQLQEDWLTPSADGVTVASRTLQTKAWGMGIAPQRVLYLPNGVTALPLLSGAGLRARLGIAADAPVLLLYTRFFEFSQEKLHFLFAEIYRLVPQVRFLVVGKGRNNEEEQLLNAAAHHEFAPALIMAGWVEPGSIPEYLAVADVAIYPFADNLINRSKCPAKLTELLRAEVAVVADRVGQLAEYIRPGVSGMLCEPEDWQEMAERAAELLLNRDNSLRLGRAGRSYLLGRFSWRNLAEQLDAFYKELARI